MPPILRHELNQKGLVPVERHPAAEFFPNRAGTGVNDTFSVLSIDIETYSSVPIKYGVYKYVESPDFEVLLLAYKFNNDPVKIVDIASGERIPAEVLAWLQNPFCRKIAFNANFERTCLAEWLRLPMYPEQWHCTMAQALLCGLPASLESVSAALRLEGKDKEGGRLIRKFSCPVKATKANGMQTRNYPEFEPEDWELFKAYCIKDVEAEEAVRKAIPNYLKGREREMWTLDQNINDRGISFDRPFVEACVKQRLEYKDVMIERAAAITDLSNPNSGKQMKDWLEQELGVAVDSLAKDKIGEVVKLATSAGADHVVQALEMRGESSKSSLAKYDTMLNSACNDDRVRGMFQYAGASRTARWAGRIINLQNLRKNSMKGLFEAREIVRMGDMETTEMMYGNVADVLSQLIRTSFVAEPRKQLLVADFSAIEARVIAWLAQEQWRIDTFESHGMIYEASASQAFKVPIGLIAQMENGEKVKGPRYDLRAKGKVMELSCGYGGGVGALIRMGALEGGIPEHELQGMVNAWRAASPRIVALWKAVEAAAIKCVETGLMQSVRCLVFRIEGQALTITLPSGRKLVYQSPTLSKNRFGGMSLSYMGNDQGHWSKIATYGGSLVENLCQAIARDCLAESMLRLASDGYKICLHVHDEVVCEEMEVDGKSLERMIELMCQPMPWATDLVLKADGYSTKYYHKKD